MSSDDIAIEDLDDVDKASLMDELERVLEKRRIRGELSALFAPAKEPARVSVTPSPTPSAAVMPTPTPTPAPTPAPAPVAKTPDAPFDPFDAYPGRLALPTRPPQQAQDLAERNEAMRRSRISGDNPNRIA
jgi:hypothetical protein